MDKQYYEIIVKSPENEELNLKLHWDSDIDAWLEKIRVILKWVTFADKTIADALPTEDDLLDKEEKLLDEEDRND